MNRSFALTATIRAGALLVIGGAVLAVPDALTVGARLCTLAFARLSGFVAALLGAEWPQLFAAALAVLLAVVGCLVGTALGQRQGRRDVLGARRR